MYCQECGSKLPENAKFCSNCGTKVWVEESKEEVSALEEPMVAVEENETEAEESAVEAATEDPIADNKAEPIAVTPKKTVKKNRKSKKIFDVKRRVEVC